MKKNILFLSLIIPLTMASCTDSEYSSDTLESSTSSSSQISSSTTVENEDDTTTSIPDIAQLFLEISSLPNKTTYDRYDNLDLSGLKVSRVTSDILGNVLLSTEVTDYSVFINGTEYHDGDILTMTGRRTTVTIRTTDELEASFEIAIYSLRSFSQYLEIDSLPSIYNRVGDKLDLSNLEVTMVTTRINADGESSTIRDVLGTEDYTLSVNGAMIGDYEFADVGRHVLSISTQGYESVITREFTFYCLDKTSVSPLSYPGDEKLVEDDSTMTVRITLDPSDDTYDNYYSPEQVTVENTIYDYGFKAYDNWVYAPSSKEEGVQQTPLLVVPVVIGDTDEDTVENRQLIEKTFFGLSDDLEYESLRSFYRKSSYGKLDIVGSVTDYYYALEQSSFPSTGFPSNNDLINLSVNVSEWAEEVYNLDMKEYDSDADGRIDALWIVYLGRSTYNGSTSSLWPMSFTTGLEGNIDDPNPNNVGWIGLDMIDGSYSSYINQGGDAHIVIHETGHLLGLIDYYSYNYYDLTYSPTGGKDVMDGGIMDHNPYSKMMLGWTTPYVVYGNAEITIKSCQSLDSLIIIPYDNKTYRTDNDGHILFNPFDEYLVLDYYTDSNMNAYGYNFYQENPINGQGGRLYHADARLAYESSTSQYQLFTDPDEAFLHDGKIAKLISNSSDDYYSESAMGLIGEGVDLFDELRWISQDGIKVDSSHKPSTDSLFEVGDSFSLESFANQFNNSAMNSGNSLSYTFEIVSIS